MALFCLTAELSLLPVHTSAAEFMVRVEDSFFEPFQLAIDVNDTVVWTGFGAQDHSVTSDDGLFNSLVLFSETFSYTFQTPGVYPYYCENHGNPGGDGMSGTVVVSAGTMNRAPNRPSNLSPANGASNQPPTLQLRASSFSDPDPLDFQSASQWIVRRASDSVIVFDTGEDSGNRTNRTVAEGALTNGITYSWQLRYKDGRGSWSPYSAPTTFTTLIPFVQTGLGLLARYGNSTNAPSLAVTTNEMIHFNWGQERPHRRITADAFVVRWEGFVLPQFTERYEFQFQYRGKARLWVDNQLLIDESNDCSFSQTRRASINLVAAQLFPLRIDYVAAAGGAQAILRWASPSQPMQIVPASRLFPASP
jgi:plastocyanin